MSVLRVLLAILLLLSSIQFAAAQETITMVFGDRYPPFYWTTSRDDPESFKGMFMDFLNMFLAEHPEYTIRKIILPRRRMDMALETGEGDAFALNSPSFAKTDYDSYSRFTTPLWEVSDHLVVRAEDSNELTEVADIYGKKVGVIWGNGYLSFEKHFESGLVEPVSVYRSAQLFRLLHEKRTDALIANKHSMPRLAKNAGFNPAEFLVIKEALYSFPLAVQVRKECAKFYEDIERFVQKCRNDGRLRRLAAKYLPED